ncbi:caspase family protein [Streptomyces sp. ALI-76-A]|uniref:caspase family protein n=1 Tax=Streptomyces sp. ALI-76-A TaxID=3025736 RepID=UPI00256EE5DE|nr:caspase family protein [Streptomyces sp. ALI-76-A]MDL5205158.1 caspase family protein [Streptomyces sp. ALI-76-A]
MTGPRHALIIANDRYDDQGLKKLRAPAQDATALAAVLHDPEIGDFEVDVVRNEPAHVMRREIQLFFNDRRRDDVMVLHFSCHGIKSESGELYFAAKDTDPRLLDATAVPAQFVRQCMSRSRAGSTVLFLDCCYGGAFSRGSSSVRATGEVNVLESFGSDPSPGGRGWAVITASNSMEYAFEGPELAENSAPRPSVFTRAVVQGLESGEADLDEDGEISCDELYDYVFDHVRDQNPNQTPSRTVEMQGDLHLAHSRRGRIKIAGVPSPPYLLDAIGSDNPLTRQGAVQELRSRLHDDSLPIAEGARHDLEKIARDDIRQIADQAVAALREIRLAPSPHHLDFGTVQHGSTPPQQTVTLGGPPLARHCVAQSQQSWLRVEPSTTGLNVRVETNTEGHLTGDIVLKGVVGEASVHVEVEVEPTQEQTVVVHTPPPRPAPDPPPPAPPPFPPPPSPPPSSPPAQSRPRTRQRTQAAPPAPAETRAQRPNHREGQTASGAGSGLRRAPALAAAALVCAVTAVVLFVLAAQGAAEAIERRRTQGGSIETHVHDVEALTPLTVSLVTAAAALVLVPLARHHLDVWRERYTKSASGLTRTLTALAKGPAVTILVLAVLTGLTYIVGSGKW